MSTIEGPLQGLGNTSRSIQRKFSSSEKGLWAEKVCARDLTLKGREILWQRRRLIGVEIDICCRYRRSLELVEVKTAGPGAFKNKRVSDKQIRRLFRAKSYLQKGSGREVKLVFAFVKDQGHIQYLPLSSLLFLK